MHPMHTRARTSSPLPLNPAAADVSASQETAASDSAHPQGVPTNQIQPDPNHTGPAGASPPPADSRLEQILTSMQNVVGRMDAMYAQLGAVATQVTTLSGTVNAHGQQLTAFSAAPHQASAHADPLLLAAAQSPMGRPHTDGQPRRRGHVNPLASGLHRPAASWAGYARVALARGPNGAPGGAGRPRGTSHDTAVYSSRQPGLVRLSAQRPATG